MARIVLQPFLAGIDDQLEHLDAGIFRLDVRVLRQPGDLEVAAQTQGRLRVLLRVAVENLERVRDLARVLRLLVALDQIGVGHHPLGRIFLPRDRLEDLSRIVDRGGASPVFSTVVEVDVSLRLVDQVVGPIELRLHQVGLILLVRLRQFREDLDAELDLGVGRIVERPRDLGAGQLGGLLLVRECLVQRHLRLDRQELRELRPRGGGGGGLLASLHERLEILTSLPEQLRLLVETLPFLGESDAVAGLLQAQERCVGLVGRLQQEVDVLVRLGRESLLTKAAEKLELRLHRLHQRQQFLSSTARRADRQEGGEGECRDLLHRGNPVDCPRAIEGRRNVPVRSERHERNGGFRFQYKRVPPAVKSPTEPREPRDGEPIAASTTETHEAAKWFRER